MSYFYGNEYSYMSISELEEKSRRILSKHPDYDPVEVSSQKTICSSWWGQSWCKNLERYADWSNRIERGRKYVRHDAVINLKIDGGKINALVVGSEKKPYEIEIKIAPLSPERQKKIERLASGKIQNLEALVSGSFPEDLKESLFQEGVLFPEPDEIEFECSCPDYAYMCKHVAAVLYGIGVRLDRDPLCLFKMRGIETEKFISETINGKVEKMLANAKKKSSRILSGDDLSVFGLMS